MNCHLQKLAKGIQIYSNNYDDILLMGYFNAEVTNTSFFSFCKLNSMKEKALSTSSPATKTLQIHRL